MKPNPNKLQCDCWFCQEPQTGLSLFIWALGLLLLAAWGWWG